MLFFKFIRDNISIAIPILVSSLTVLGSAIINAAIVSHSSLANWYVLAFFLPISYLILGLLESGRVCSLTAVSRHKNHDNFKRCQILSIYYSLPFILLALAFYVFYHFSLNPFNINKLNFKIFNNFVILYSLTYIVISTNSIFNAALFSYKKSFFAAASIISTSLLSVVLTYFSFHYLKLGLYSIVLGSLISYLLGCLVSMSRVYRINRYLPGEQHNYWKLNYKLFMKTGFPVFFTYVSLPVGIYFITYFLSMINSDAVTGFGIAYRLQNFFILPALAIGISSGININHATALSKKNEIFDNTLLFSLIVYIPLVFLMFVIKGDVSCLLTSNIKAQEIVTNYFRYVSWSYLIFCPLVSIIAVLEQTGFPIKSLISNVIMLGAQIILAAYITYSNEEINKFFELLSLMLIAISLLLLILNVYFHKNTLLKVCVREVAHAQ